jgi:hypothetical protein
MIRKISYLKKPVSQMTLQDSAKALNKVAQKSEEVALDFVAHGLKGKVTPTFIKQTGAGDAFEKSGVIKPKFFELISAKYNLTAGATIEEYINAIVKSFKK